MKETRGTRPASGSRLKVFIQMKLLVHRVYSERLPSYNALDDARRSRVTADHVRWNARTTDQLGLQAH